MKNGVAYQNQKMYLKINIYLNQLSTFILSQLSVIIYKPVHWFMEQINGMASMQWQDWIEIS